MTAQSRKATAVVCYLIALLGSAVFGGLILGHGFGLLDRALVSLPCPWLIDVGWLLLFGLQHSVMARRSAKRLWEAWLPAGLARSTYAALSGLLLLGLAATWQPVGGAPLWELPRGFVVVPLLAGAGMAYVNLRFDHAGLFGLRQACATNDETAEPLLVEGPYRFVRHPLMACVLVFLWTQPRMTPTLALLCGGMTIYVVIGLVFEERDLSTRFAPAYAGYRQSVPALLPWRTPVEARRCRPGETFEVSHS